MAHRSDSEASRLGLNLLLSNHCHWHRLVCYHELDLFSLMHRYGTHRGKPSASLGRTELLRLRVALLLLPLLLPLVAAVVVAL